MMKFTKSVRLHFTGSAAGAADGVSCCCAAVAVAALLAGVLCAWGAAAGVTVVMTLGRLVRLVAEASDSFS